SSDGQRLLLEEHFRERQKALWDAVDLPWGHGPDVGLHTLPFRNLRFLSLQWSVFSWTPPPEHGLVGSINPDHWPGYQLAMLIAANADTLDHISIYGYPGFQLERYDSISSGDALLDLLAKNAPNLQTLSLGGLREPYFPHLQSVQPKGTDDFLSESHPVYPSGKEVPYVMSVDNPLPPENFTGPSLKRVFIQGFDPESTVLIEDAIFNRGVFSVRSLTHLALSVMPKDYDYMFMFSKVQTTLTHLTLDMNDSTRYLSLKFWFFPKLEVLQLRIHTAYRTWNNFHDMVESLSDNVYHLDGSLPIVQEVKLLHVLLGPSLYSILARNFLHHASVDELLESLVCVSTSGLPESMGRTRVDQITISLPETILAEMLPMAYGTGRLKQGNTDYWWYQPTYL
ncbi:hypothetical protein F5878DRAFT_636446, partial [Lentinula raphanica]